MDSTLSDWVSQKRPFSYSRFAIDEFDQRKKNRWQALLLCFMMYPFKPMRCATRRPMTMWAEVFACYWEAWQFYCYPAPLLAAVPIVAPTLTATTPSHCVRFPTTTIVFVRHAPLSPLFQSHCIVCLTAGEILQQRACLAKYPAV